VAGWRRALAPCAAVLSGLAAVLSLQAAGPGGVNTPAVIVVASDAPAEAARLAALLAPLRGPGTMPRIVAAEVADDAQDDLAAVRRALTVAAPGDVVYATTMTRARTVQRAEPARRIVFDGASDAEQMCLVDSNTRPGRSATGYTSHVAPEGKLVETLIDAYPDLREVVLLIDGSSAPDRRPDPRTCAAASPPPPVGDCRENRAADPAIWSDTLDIASAAAAAVARGVALRWHVVCTAEQAGAALRERGGDPTRGAALPVQYLFWMQHEALSAEARRHRVRTIFPRSFMARGGAPLAISPMGVSVAREESAAILSRVLDGEAPASLPVRRPAGFEVVVNVAAASDPLLRPSLSVLWRAELLRP
jgi:putative ABC transport system substrate-binding protein